MPTKAEPSQIRYKRMGSREKRRLRRFANFLSVTAIAGILMLILLWDLMVFTTPVGHTAVEWHRFNLDGEGNSEGPLGEGVHVIWPWDELYIYDVRLQTYDQVYEVVTADGLHVEITMTFRWRAVRRNIVELNTAVGPNYLQTLLVPVVGSVAREVISRYDAEKLYSGERDDIQGEIYKRIVSHDYPDGIGQRQTAAVTEDLVIMEDTLIKRVRLPAQLQSAIEQKLEQAQLVQGYRFRVEREELESKRKEVEAHGVRRFQEIVSPAISESYLRWRGIEATLELSKSPNAKVVVIGNSETGLPLILDTGSQDLAMPSASELAPLPDFKPLFPDAMKSSGSGDEPAITQDPVDTKAALQTGDVQDPQPGSDGPEKK